MKWLQKAFGFASYVDYKYRYDTLYCVNTFTIHTVYLSKRVIGLTKQLIQYLWSTRRKKLIWNKDHSYEEKINLIALTDAAFANQKHLKSQFGNMFYVNGKLIGARSSRSSACTSSIESEIYSICKAVARLLNLKILVKELSNDIINCTILTGR